MGVVLRVFLALVEVVHVLLAVGNVVILSFEAVHKRLTEALADVILWLSLLHLLWVCLLLVLLWHLLLLLLLGWGLSVATAASHHSSDSLVGNLASSSESHTSSHGLHETTTTESHSAALLRRLSWCLWCRSWGLCG